MMAPQVVQGMLWNGGDWLEKDGKNENEEYE